MPKKYSTHKKKPRGVANRNAGLEYVRKHAKEGVVYFGDDDNTYDIQIFEEVYCFIRYFQMILVARHYNNGFESNSFHNKIQRSKKKFEVFFKLSR